MFSDRVLDHFHNPRRSGALDGATHRGVAGVPGDGPYMILWLKIEEGRIAGASYETFGCPAAVACGSMAAEIVTGKPTEFALKIDANDLAVLLGGLPEGKEHCPRLAVDALRAALVTEV